MPLGVVYKFFDDQGGYLAAVLTYYAFVSIFPILLIASAVLGFVLQGQPELQRGHPRTRRWRSSRSSVTSWVGPRGSRGVRRRS